MIRLKYGNTNTFYIKGENAALLVDTDYAGKLGAFYREIKRHDVRVSDIAYVLATHYHPDHMGLIGELMQQGVGLLLTEEQTQYVHFSDNIFARDIRLGYQPIDESGAVRISCAESRGFLQKLGIDGEIISTPSHSADSISLILDSGICIVGDLEPREYLDAYAENIPLKTDWERIMSFDPREIHYAHANEKIIKND